MGLWPAEKFESCWQDQTPRADSIRALLLSTSFPQRAFRPCLRNGKKRFTNLMQCKVSSKSWPDAEPEIHSLCQPHCWRWHNLYETTRSIPITVWACTQTQAVSPSQRHQAALPIGHCPCVLLVRHLLLLLQLRRLFPPIYWCIDWVVMLWCQPVGISHATHVEINEISVHIW